MVENCPVFWILDHTIRSDQLYSVCNHHWLNLSTYTCSNVGIDDIGNWHKHKTLIKIAENLAA